MSYTSDNTAYTILINEDNTMTTTHKRRIVQRSKLVDDLWFLVPPLYNGYDMSKFTVSLEYLLPVSHRYQHEILILSSDTYNGHLKYVLPFDSNLTAEAGDIEIVLTFLIVELDDLGKAVQRVRKVRGAKVHIDPITAWCDIIPDSALSSLDQRIIKTDAQIRAISEITDAMYHLKADNLTYNSETSELQLIAGGTAIGDKVVIGYNEDGIPAVDFSNISGDVGTDKEDIEDNVVEF